MNPEHQATFLLDMDLAYTAVMCMQFIETKTFAAVPVVPSV